MTTLKDVTSIFTKGATKSCISQEKKDVDFSGYHQALLEAKKEAAQNAGEEYDEYLGKFCHTMAEVAPGQPGGPKFNQAPCEEVWEGANNTCIVLGRDRTGPMDTGYGGQGHTQSGMIDIVVGRDGPCAGLFGLDPETNEPYYLEPIFKDEIIDGYPLVSDSARIYISQKTDIDNAFGLRSSLGAPNIRIRSGIAMKADLIRIIGKEGIRLVTKSADFNSLGGKIESVRGIDLVAGNDPTDLQPMVKGDNLVGCLKGMQKNLRKYFSMMDSFITYQMEFNSKVANHNHTTQVGPAALPTLPSIPVVIAGIKAQASSMKTKMSGMFNDINWSGWESNYLSPGASNSILSNFNHTN